MKKNIILKIGVALVVYVLYIILFSALFLEDPTMRKNTYIENFEIINGVLGFSIFILGCMFFLSYASNKLADAPTKDIKQLEAERLQWSLGIFTEATPISSLAHLRKEIDEIESDIKAGIREPIEYADALGLLFDSAGRQGIYPAEIFEAFEKKLAINKARNWTRNDNNTYSHTKTE